VVLRPVSREDAMTADRTRLPCQLLARISTRITNEVPGVNRVVLDVTSKPSGTIKIVESPIIRPQQGSKR
jgi:GMP synthase (glutamine-hydrolysing)